MSDRLNTTTHCAREAFASRFTRQAEYTSYAPGRVNLIGDHTDYNDGLAMPMAIDRHAVVAAAVLGSDNRHSTVYSGTLDKESELNIDAPLKHEPGWARYIAGVLHLSREVMGGFQSFLAYIESDVPTGAGLSSSAAVAVAMVNLVEGLTDNRLDPLKKAQLCQQAEHLFAGVHCGIMDQIAITSAKQGYATLLDCQSLAIEYVELDPRKISVLIVDTGVSRELVTSVYGERRKTCQDAATALGVVSLRELNEPPIGLPESQLQRVRHVIHENRRVIEFADALRRQDWVAAGRRMYESHYSLRDDYEMSCDELDCLVDLAHKIGHAGGVFGCRMTGGGKGGCVVALVDPTMRDTVTRRLQAAFSSLYGRVPASF
jgi:galactokinase